METGIRSTSANGFSNADIDLDILRRQHVATASLFTADEQQLMPIDRIQALRVRIVFAEPHCASATTCN